MSPISAGPDRQRRGVQATARNPAQRPELRQREDATAVRDSSSTRARGGACPVGGVPKDRRCSWERFYTPSVERGLRFRRRYLAPCEQCALQEEQARAPEFAIGLADRHVVEDPGECVASLRSFDVKDSPLGGVDDIFVSWKLKVSM